MLIETSPVGKTLAEYYRERTFLSARRRVRAPSCYRSRTVSHPASEKLLIVNADDYGYTASVSEGIRLADVAYTKTRNVSARGTVKAAASITHSVVASSCSCKMRRSSST
jgi:hypothetical protein